MNDADGPDVTWISIDMLAQAIRRCRRNGGSISVGWDEGLGARITGRDASGTLTWEADVSAGVVRALQYRATRALAHPNGHRR